MKRLSPALVVSLIALFVALGGTSYAAITSLPKNSVGTAQIKNGAVTAPKVASGLLPLSGAVSDDGTTASFYLGGSGMSVSEISPGVTQLTVTNATSQPILSVTAVASDSTQHCGIGSAINTTTYQIVCWDQGQHWPTAYHVIALRH